MKIIQTLIRIVLSLSIIFVFAFRTSPLPRVLATEPEIIISEIMYDPNDPEGLVCRSDSCEWFEIQNLNSVTIDLKQYQFFINDKKLDLIFPTDEEEKEVTFIDDYFVMTRNKAEFVKLYPKVEPMQIIEMKNTSSLTNTPSNKLGPPITIKKNVDQNVDQIDSITYHTDWGAGAGYSLERTDDNYWYPSFSFGGTPGEEGSLEQIDFKNFLKLLSPADNNRIINEEIDFSWEDSFSCSSCQYNLLVSKDQNFSNLLVNEITSENDFSAKFDLGDYFWKIVRNVKIFNGFEENNLVLEKSDPWQFSVLPAATEGLGPINSEVIEISTGEAGNYLNYLVKVSGTVVANYATVFYLDDGSGRLKIYLPKAANLNKSQVKKGFEVSVVGVIEEYEGTFRLVLRHQEDLEVLSTLSTSSSKSSKTTKTTSGTKSGSSSANSSQTNLLNQGLVKGINFSALQKTQDLIQLIEKVLILALIFLGLIFVEWRWSILATAKNKPEK